MTGEAGALRVVHVVPSWLPLTEPWLHNELRFLPDGTASAVATKRRIEAGFPWPDITVLPGASRLDRWLGPRALARRQQRALARLIHARGAQVVHSHFGNIGWEDLPAVRRTGVAHVTSFYGQELTRFPRQDPAWTERYREMLAEVDAVLCEGPYMAATVKAIHPQARTVLHGLGVELDRLPFTPRSRGKELKVLVAGTFREKKGIPDALEAMDRLAAQGVPVRLTLIGDAGKHPSEQAEKARILELLQRPSLRDRHRNLGFVDHATFFAEAQAHDVFLSPSVLAKDGDSEGGAPVSIIELAATGMPVVSTTNCDIPHVLPPESARLLAPEHDPEGLAHRLQWLWESPQEWATIARAQRRHVEANHDARRQGQRLAQHYRDAIAARRR